MGGYIGKKEAANVLVWMSVLGSTMATMEALLRSYQPGQDE